MHELAVTEQILTIAAKHAEDANAKKITDIYLVIGNLSSIVDDSVQFYWDIISQDTICAGSKIHFKRIQAKFLCLDCQNEYSIQQEMIPCPKCGSTNTKITAGEEFFLESIEVIR